MADIEPLKVSDPDPIRELCESEYVHIAIESDIPGFLHLFNIGWKGRPTKLVPDSPKSASEVLANRVISVQCERSRCLMALRSG